MSGSVPERLREIAEAVYRAGLAAADPSDAVLRWMRVDESSLVVGDEAVPLAQVDRIWVLGAGKGARRMAAGVVELLGARVSGGSIVVPDGLGRPLSPVDVWEAAHPIPDVRGLAAAAEALRVARSAAAQDLVLCLVSGGASSLWSAPAGDISLGDLQELTRSLMHAGAPIDELNIVRRQTSNVGGGKLARAAAPARVVTLAVSDVLGGAPHDIGSGPTSPDPTSPHDALRVIADRGVSVPAAVRRHLQAGAEREAREVPRADEGGAYGSFHVVASLRDALAAAAEEAVRLGYPATVVSDRLSGSARAAGDEVARAVMLARDSGDGPRALLWGGETTVEVRGNGRGGRNQELALAAASRIAGVDDVVIAALATDGLDGASPAAGAIVDGGTVRRGRNAGLDPRSALDENDSYGFLSATGDAVLTGPTGTNVNDLVIALIR